MDIYRENILDHYKNPRNKGKLAEFSIHIHDDNPLCGDEVDWYIDVDNGRIEEVKFLGHGCAISQAASSMVSEEVKGANLKDVIKINNEEIFELLGTTPSISRVKCALLGLKALQKAIIQFEAKNG